MGSHSVTYQPGRGDIPALTPAEAGTRLSDHGGMQGWVDLEIVVVRECRWTQQVASGAVGSANVWLCPASNSNQMGVVGSRELCLNFGAPVISLERMWFWDGNGTSWTICKQAAPRSRHALYIHCESKKTRHLTLAHNFTKYWPIFKSLSLLDSVGNL